MNTLFITQDTGECQLTNKKISTTWRSMIARCYRETHQSYKDYGGRGIKVCPEWLDSSKSFIEWALANGYKQGLTLDRIRNNGNYSPDNCRFATRREQARNRRSNVPIIYEDRIMILTDWITELGISYRAYYYWLHKGLMPAAIIQYFTTKKLRKVA